MISKSEKEQFFHLNRLISLNFPEKIQIKRLCFLLDEKTLFSFVFSNNSRKLNVIIRNMMGKFYFELNLLQYIDKNFGDKNYERNQKLYFKKHLEEILGKKKII